MAASSDFDRLSPRFGVSWVPPGPTLGGGNSSRGLYFRESISLIFAAAIFAAARLTFISLAGSEQMGGGGSPNGAFNIFIYLFNI